jgi:hypothetical protein
MPILLREGNPCGNQRPVTRYAKASALSFAICEDG